MKVATHDLPSRVPPIDQSIAATLQSHRPMREKIVAGHRVTSATSKCHLPGEEAVRYRNATLLGESTREIEC